MTERKLLGHVDVDSGTLLLADPVYVLPNRESGRSGIDYQIVADTPVELAMAIGGQPVLLLQHFGGDGTFPVYGDFEDAVLVRIQVEFVDPDD